VYIESWATAVEIELARQTYPKYNNHQDQKIDPTNETNDLYTTIGYDLIDDYDQREEERDIDFPRDKVTGFTIKQVENSLKGTNSWDKWRENVKKENTSSSTNEQIDELFANWD